MAVKPQLCLHFSQLLSQIFVKLTSCVCLSLNSGPKVAKRSLHLEICQCLSNLWRAKQRKNISSHPPGCSTSSRFCYTIQCCQSVLQLLSCLWALMDACSVSLHQIGSERRNCFSRRNFSHAVNANGPFAPLPPPKSFLSGCVGFSASSQHKGDSWLVSKVLCVVSTWIRKWFVRGSKHSWVN